MDLSVSVSPETLFHIGSVGITNSQTTALLITLLLVGLAFFAKRSFKLVPGRLQIVLEMITSYLLGQLENAFGSKTKARQFFPMIMSMLLFLFIANQLTVIPVMSQLLLDGQTLFRSPTSHLAAPLAFAILTLGTAHLLALKISPFRHIGNFIKVVPLFRARTVGQFGNALLELFLGVMDIVGEFAKVLSLSFRLFGNIFAGELIIAVIGSLSVYTTVFAPVPFLALSIFSGVIQAFVFTMLSIQFISSSINAVQTEREAEEVTSHETLSVPVAIPVRVK